MLISVFDRVENIVGKGENAGYQHFLLFPPCFQKFFFQGCYKLASCGKKLSKSPFEDFVRKGKNTGDQHYFLNHTEYGPV